MLHNNPNSTKRTYDRCVFLVFNCKSEAKLSSLEMVLIEGVKNKWKKNHNDPNGERIEFIYVHPNDFDPYIANDKYEIARRNHKYAALARLTSHSHLYLIGHHEINDNRLEVSDDGYNGKTSEKYEYYDIDEIADLLLKYIKHPSVRKHRELLQAAPTDAIKEQRIMISIAMCNTAVGLLVNGERKTENSFSYQMASRLFNRHPLFLLDCVVSGSTGWLFPTPGEPSFAKLLKLLIADVNSICNDDHYRQSAHKRYLNSLSFFGKLYEIPLLMQGKQGQYKKYFAPSPMNDLDAIRERRTIILSINGSEWYKAWHSDFDQAVKSAPTKHPAMYRYC